jgi:hypothetical protein
MSSSPPLRAAILFFGLAFLASLSITDSAFGAQGGSDVVAKESGKSSEASPARRKIRMHLVGPDGKPVPRAQVRIGVWSEDKFRPKREHTTDAEGTVEIELPTQLRIVRFWTSADKLVSMFVHWEERDEPEKSLPADFTIPLEKATTIGGYVVDERGKPIGGAKVDVQLQSGGKKDEGARIAYDRWLASNDDALFTDADGHWSLANVPAADDIQIALDKSKARQFERQQKSDWTHGFVGDWYATDVPSRLDINGVPFYFILDKQGRLVWRGFSTDEIEKQLAALMTKE